MKVSETNTAISMGSGDLPVFATPSMVALMENAAMILAKEFCSAEETTVGTMISVNHTRATPIGAKVRATSELVERDGRKLIFKIIASDEKGEIGNGEHHRFVVNREKFMSKL